MIQLAQSIKEQGVIVPIKVRPAQSHLYEVVYGHRRVEAARRVGLSEIPAFVEGVDDTNALIQALIENVQREDMEPIDLAQALKELQDVTGWSQHEMARQGIMPPKTISVTMALLREDPSVQTLVRRGPQGGHESPIGVISREHVTVAREVGLDPEQRRQTLHKAAQEGLSISQTRQVAESIAAAGSEKRRQYLIDHPYSPYTHNPTYQRQREQQYGDHDVLLQDKRERPADEGWIGLPSVKQAIDTIKWWECGLKDLREMADEGKMAPEAKRFIAHRLESFAEELESLIMDFGE